MMKKKHMIAGLLAAAAGLILLAAPFKTQAASPEASKTAARKQLERQLVNQTALGGILREVPAPQAKARYLVAKETMFLMGEKDWEQFSQSINKYDKKGRQTYNKFTYKDWNEEKQEYEEHTSEWKSVYDSKGRETKYTNYQDGKEEARTEYKYNSKNQITELKNYSYKKLSGRYVYSYNKNGKVSRLIFYNAKNKEEWRRTYTFDSHGNAKKVVQKNPKGKVLKQWTIKNTYSGKRLTKSVETDKDKTYKLTMTYYKNENLKTYLHESDSYVLRQDFYENGSMKRFEMTEEHFYRLETYNTDGSLKKELAKWDDYSSETIYKNGYPEKTTIIQDGKKYVHTYKYKKSSGRVVRQTEYHGDDPIQKIEFKYVKIG